MRTYADRRARFIGVKFRITGTAHAVPAPFLISGGCAGIQRLGDNVVEVKAFAAIQAVVN